MHRTTAEGFTTVDGKRYYIDQNLPTTAGSTVGGKGMNAIQEELAAVMELNGIAINDGVATDPMDQVYQTIFASAKIGTAALTDSAVTAGKLATSAVTTDKINASAVTAVKILDLNVIASKLGENAVITDKIATGAVTADKMAVDSVVTGSIVNGAVTTDKLGNNVVGTDQLKGNAVTESILATDAVTTSRIADGSVTTVKLEESLRFFKGAEVQKVGTGPTTALSVDIALPATHKRPSMVVVEVLQENGIIYTFPVVRGTGGSLTQSGASTSVTLTSPLDGAWAILFHPYFGPDGLI